MTLKLPFFFSISKLNTIYASHIRAINAPSPDGSGPIELAVRLHTRQYYAVF